MRNITILIVDDEPSYLELMKGLLQQEGYNEIITEVDPKKVLNVLENNNIDLILLDVYMPGLNGLDLLELIHQFFPKIPVVMVTAVDAIEIALRAIKTGAYEYITKPPDTDRLFLTIRRALEQRLLELEVDSLRSAFPKLQSHRQSFSNIISKSPSMLKIFELVEIFAPTNEIVLITGETGTGKDLIAKKIHQLSPRISKPFVAVSLSSISENYLERELFGYAKNSLKASSGHNKGYFEKANGGTIFLDGVEDLPKEMQGKLLRVIQYHEVLPAGCAAPIQIDVRIIASANKKLFEYVESKEFRADLYYQLNRGLLQLPLLKERKEDIPLLAKHFLEVTNSAYKKNITGISDPAMELLMVYDYPGNVRELENIIFNAAAKTATNTKIDIGSLPKLNVKSTSTRFGGVKFSTLDSIEKEHILSVLNHVDGNIQKAAAILGISVRTLEQKLQRIKQ